MNNTHITDIAASWFESKNWTAFPFQQKTWKAFLDGKHGLLNAPTGSGKTYALWVPIVLQYLKENPNYKTKHTKGIKAIWITPLRALSIEIQQSAQRFADDLGTGLTVGIRTGDTSQSDRAKQKRQMPDLLITTPESLMLLLASKDYDKTFKSLTAIVVDEWHELLGSKRGVQMELALSRLKTVSPKLRIWGISATIGNLEEAMDVLLGVNRNVTLSGVEGSVLIKSEQKSKIEVRSIIPKKMETFPWRGHLGLHLLEEIVPIIKASKTTIIFTNTRGQCEIWFQKLLEKHPEFAGEIAMHHGSIAKDTRLWVEQAIRNESLLAVVATSSLDLGVDFAPVETVIQIGSPKGVAKFLQRAGRSNHRPGEPSVIYFLPTHALELLEASALKRAVKDEVVEDRIPYLLSFDVLIQYLVTLAVSNGFFPKEIFPEIKSTFCFQGITEEKWNWCLNFITLGSQSLQAYDEYKKVEVTEEGLFKVESKQVAMMHRLSIGTIVSDSMMQVKYVSGGFIGTIEEWFISKMKPGDTFVFAGRTLELVRLRQMQAQVRKSKKRTANVVSFMGGRLPLSSQMSKILREEMQSEADHKRNTPELKALSHIFDRQERESIVPGENEFLIETFKTREGYHSIFYPFEGRFVHEAMSSLLAYRISLLSPITFSLAYNDYGFELLSDQFLDIQTVLDNNLFSAEYLFDDLQKSLNSTELARRKFRDIAVISGMVFQGYPNKVIKTKHLQSNSQLLFDVFRDYEPDNLLYLQAYRETFEHQLEEGRLRLALERINSQKIIWKQCEKATPFSFPIITDRLREKLSSEKLADRIKRMTLQLMK
ncbi:ligase-associated DNA damage response DEXH box helicase [Aequorivita lipolytica]|uniref:Ligase-associated DNA damage response DEXH box helicase n=1 Tax=Aequorivita lipolytica TaxID=153267 RepID=A0A5C6YSE2_9FLAO|nr:ligase-associated DNA damage response DEXH box helicase [Aequorivita lipolytica]TXD70328.1 ligase-associated DNA damage response DEXH box helicase [Aequorivita lipolytica]SRX50757.1 DEAD-box ATP-dependent RNA helicase RhpA [Aequorivita lipolytica]